VWHPTSGGWCILMAFCLVLVGRSGVTDDVVYTNDFNGKPNTEYPEWTSSPVVYFNSSTSKEEVGRLDAPKVQNSDSPNGKQPNRGSNRPAPNVRRNGACHADRRRR
jgi:hypothetical protein